MRNRKKSDRLVDIYREKKKEEKKG